MGQKIKTGRLEVNLDSIFDPDYFSEVSKKQREEEREKYLRQIGFEV